MQDTQGLLQQRDHHPSHADAAANRTQQPSQNNGDSGPARGTASNSNHKQTHRYQPPRRHTTPTLIWAGAVACVLFWVLVIVGGVAVLVVYLVFRPRSPRLDISSASLNGAYLDMGTLLNADLILLANFSNPNHKVDVSFSYLVVELYYGGTLIATRAIEPFAAASGETVIRSVHMVSSEVELAREAAEGLRKQVEGDGAVEFRVEGTFRAKSHLVRFLHFSYWLYSHCRLVVSAPPSGVLLSSTCRTKR